jgi:hypothetical protein
MNKFCYSTVVVALMAAGGVSSMWAQPFALGARNFPPPREAPFPNRVFLPNPYQHGEGLREDGQRSSSFSGGLNAIRYHGGPVIGTVNPAVSGAGAVRVYVIWYGNWTDTTVFPPGFNNPMSIVTDFLNSLGGSPYYNINTTYYMISGGVGWPIKNSVKYISAASDNYSLGKSLTTAQVQQVVVNALAANMLPYDGNGVYFVLTTPDVTVGDAPSGYFCKNWCGYHSWGNIGGFNIKFAFVGSPAQCPGACSEYASYLPPNGSVDGDGMVNIMAHELEEAASDENGNAWFDGYGAENADKCAWHFGSAFYTPNTSPYPGAVANMQLPTASQPQYGKVTQRYYLIQQNWVNSGRGYCALSY